ncbi:MAG: hypothetical protein DI535_15850 [Citrobacter freundii]|nr:MAG: hypothetical protein DI535_15850 [Citrobacter freundii]
MNLLDLTSWWQLLPAFEKIFWGFAIVFTLLFLIQTIVSFAAGDGDIATGDADMAIDHDGGIDYGFFTIKNFIAFFTIFGWTGIALSKGDVSKPLTIVIALLAGLAVVSVMVFIMRSMNKLRQSGTFQIGQSLNKTAETYLIIPAARNGFGKVHIRVQGSLRELKAITDDTGDIPTGRLVKVTGIIDENILLVTSQLS